MATVHEVPFRTIPQHISPLPAKKRPLETNGNQMKINNIINPISDSPPISKVVATVPVQTLSGTDAKKKQPHKHPKLAHAKSKLLEPKGKHHKSRIHSFNLVTSSDRPIVHNTMSSEKPLSPKMPSYVQFKHQIPYSNISLSIMNRDVSSDKLNTIQRPAKMAKRLSPPRETTTNNVVRYTSLQGLESQLPRRIETDFQTKKQAIQSAKTRFSYYQTGDSLYSNHLIPTLPTFLLGDFKKDESGNVLVENGEIV
jgi:N-acetylmuramoyl-L-alanine amidase CwlA